MLNNASELLHTKGHLSKTRSTAANVRPRSVHSRTKVRLFATSLLGTVVYLHLYLQPIIKIKILDASSDVTD